MSERETGRLATVGVLVSANTGAPRIRVHNARRRRLEVWAGFGESLARLHVDDHLCNSFHASTAESHNFAPELEAGGGRVKGKLDAHLVEPDLVRPRHLNATTQGRARILRFQPEEYSLAARDNVRVGGSRMHDKRFLAASRRHRGLSSHHRVDEGEDALLAGASARRLDRSGEAGVGDDSDAGLVPILLVGAGGPDLHAAVFRPCWQIRARRKLAIQTTGVVRAAEGDNVLLLLCACGGVARAAGSGHVRDVGRSGPRDGILLVAWRDVGSCCKSMRLKLRSASS